MSVPSAPVAAAPRPYAPAEAGSGPAAASGRCFHCGNPNPEPAPWTFEMAGAPRHFCCAGCLGIARTIQAAGLDAFYERRTRVPDAPLPGQEADDEWSRWDDAAAQAGLVRATPDARREVSLLLEGIHCGACIWLIETWLARQPGVAEASVNFATRRARVVWDPGKERLSDLLRAVAAIGYRAHPYDPGRREAVARRESRALLLRLAVALLAMMQVMMFAVPTYVTWNGPASR
jgi:Cu2+-exporting ATPase